MLTRCCIRPLSQPEKNDLFEVFLRIGEALYIPELPKTYAEWQMDRRLHLVRDLSYSKHTSMLYQAYRKHLGLWRYYLLLEVQALLVPDEVRRLLRSQLKHRSSLVWRKHTASSAARISNPWSILY